MEGIAFLVAMHHDAQHGPPDPVDLEAWAEQHGFHADALLIDDGRHVIDAYIAANPGPTYTQAVTVVIDKDMRIRKVGGTYDAAHESNLELLLQLLDE